MVLWKIPDDTPNTLRKVPKLLIYSIDIVTQTFSRNCIYINPTLCNVNYFCNFVILENTEPKKHIK